MLCTPVVLSGLVVVMFCAAPLRSEEPDWKVGMAQVKITPEQPVFLAGYASRNKPYEK
jgi:neutral ceramidase